MTFARDFSVSSSYGADYDGLHPLQAEDGLYPLLVQDGLQVAVEALQAPFGLDVSFDKEALHPTQSPTSFAPETAQYPTIHDSISRGDCLRARLVYQTWLSQTFPTHDSSWNKDKCPMPTCDERFDNIQSLLIHLEKHCKVLKHWECWDCSRAQQPSTTPSQRHCRWCRTKHFLDGLAKRVSSTGSSLRKSLSLRKHSPKSSSSEHWDDVDCDSPVLSIPSRMSSASYSSPNPKGKQNDGDWLAPLPPPPVELRTTFGSPSSSFQGLRGVHQTRQHIPQADAIPAAPVELDARLPVELPTTESFSSFERQNTEAVKDTGAESPSGYATPAKSWTAVSAISQFTASTEACPSLVTPQTSTSSFSSSLSRLSIPESGDDGASWFGKGITSSPTDCEGEDAISDRPPWDNGYESLPSTKRLPVSTSSASRSISKTAQRSLPVAQVGPRAASAQALPTTSRSLPIPRAAPSILHGTADRLLGLPIQLPEPSHAGASSEGSSLSDSLIIEFSEIRGTPFCAAGLRADSFAGLSDYAVLMSGVDELKHQLSGKEYYSRSTSPELQLCFAYLGLAMAAIVKDHDDTGMMYAGLHQEMSAFISAEGEIGFGSLSARLRPIMEQFLNVLAVFIPRATHGSGLQPTSQTDVALQFMTSELQSRKSYLESRFSQNPSQPPRSDSEHRQQTWSSSSSTLFDTEAPDVSPTANVSNEKNPPQEIPSPDLPSGRKHGISRQAGVKKCRPKSDSDSEPVCCATCEYNPASGPDQHKKMARHNKTGSHLRKTQQDVGSQEEFPCDFVNHKGIKCGGSYNRRDNLRQHQRLVHGLILRREVQDPSGDEVDPQTMQSSAPKRRRTTRTGMGELGDELDPRTMQRPAPKRRRTTRTGMVEAGELTRSGS